MDDSLLGMQNHRTVDVAPPQWALTMCQMKPRHRHQVPLQRDESIAREAADKRFDHFIAGRCTTRPQQTTHIVRRHFGIPRATTDRAH